ncbi:MAG: DUF362 domain-containing protein [Deltaproteobacteria bacterium]|nr:DUF362 domain-containing protein [Deltaproteobacteria bacterium]
MSKRFDRRKFLKSSAASATALALGGGCTTLNPKKLQAAAGMRPPPELSRLVQTTGPGVPKDLSRAVEKLIEPLGGMQAFVKTGQRVLLKPNMGFPVPAAQRATTSAELIAAVAGLVLAKGAGQVIIADYPTSESEKTVELMGLREALKGLKVKIMPVTADSEFVEMEIPGGKSLKSAEFLKEALQADVHIALPMVKSHSSTLYTGTLKGMMGLVATRKTFHWWHNLHMAIVDLNRVIKPDLVILDGLEVMTNEGPRGPGDLEKTNSLIAGTDPVAVDAAGVRLTRLFGRRIKPEKVTHLALAASLGLGRLKLEDKHNIKIDMPA